MTALNQLKGCSKPTMCKRVKENNYMKTEKLKKKKIYQVK